MNPHENTVRILLGRAERGCDPLDPAEWKRVAARCAWVRETTARLREAQRQMDEVCTAAAGYLSEEEFELLFEAEEAKVAAIRAELDAVIERNEWPKELYFGRI